MSELYELVCKVKGVEQNKVVFLFMFFSCFSFVVNLTPDSVVFHSFGCKLFIRLVFGITSI